ncbi:ankyrin repeat domain-containing protein [Hoeflea poritis]|uniref:Ankyrin repeat domain-containing protein n=1 Tax=Hoeflea poritis TaxID=2993659 RepID=A0ABT4VT62_9HYPH|nr:ankyrin repeat domain-containing protein [Hoeflea poritis]MDA4847908.1 ankyrin repeat domain-containing protein [Hoeflea poritis]
MYPSVAICAKAGTGLCVAIFILCAIASKSVMAQDCPTCDLDWAESAKVDDVRRLFATGVSPNGRSWSGGRLSFLIAYKNPDPATLEVFFEEAERLQEPLVLVEGKAPNSIWNTALHHAARNDHTGMLKLLLEKGLSPHWTDDKYATPLMAAIAHSQNIETYLILLDAGADPNARDGLGWTAAHLVARFGRNPDVLDVLFEHGLVLDAQSDSGLSPLEIAVEYNSQEMQERFRALLEGN